MLALHCGVHCGVHYRVKDRVQDRVREGTQVRRAPLALYAARYGGGGGGSAGSGGGGAGGGGGVPAQPQPACFPEYVPDAARSRWCTLPAMRPACNLLCPACSPVRPACSPLCAQPAALCAQPAAPRVPGTLSRRCVPTSCYSSHSTVRAPAAHAPCRASPVHMHPAFTAPKPCHLAAQTVSSALTLTRSRAEP